jgi:hypothetical protein
MVVARPARLTSRSHKKQKSFHLTLRTLTEAYEKSRWPVMTIRGKRANRRFQFHKRGQLFIGVHNETLSVAMQ